MNAKSTIFLRVLLNRYHPQNVSALLKSVPAEEAKIILNQEIHSSDINPLLSQPMSLIQWLDSSWKEKFVKQFPENIRSIALAAIDVNQSTKISNPVKAFFIDLFYSYFKGADHIPLAYLPENEFSGLLKWKKPQLIQLATYLGLYDLASEIQLIVNKVQLNNLYSSLTQKQNYYLQICLSQKDKLIFPKLGINFAINDPEKIKQVLHQRGLIRFAKGLAGQNPDFIWYMFHRFDMDRAKVLQHYYNKDADSKVTPILKSQILSVMNFLSKE